MAATHRQAVPPSCAACPAMSSNWPTQRHAGPRTGADLPSKRLRLRHRHGGAQGLSTFRGHVVDGQLRLVVGRRRRPRVVPLILVLQCALVLVWQAVGISDARRLRAAPRPRDDPFAGGPYSSSGGRDNPWFLRGGAARATSLLETADSMNDDPGGSGGGESADPYRRYFFSDNKGNPKAGGNTLFRWRKDVRGYTPEARYWYNRWINGPPNTYGKSWVHGCQSFPFCNHIPPPPANLPAPWDIPTPDPNPAYPTLAPFPKNLFGKPNMYGRDMYRYFTAMPHYRKDEKFWKG